MIGTRFSAYARSYMADALREWLLAAAQRRVRLGRPIGAGASERAPTWW